MRLDDLVEALLRLKAQLTRAPGFEAGWPVLHDRPDCLVRLLADQPGDLAAGDPAQRFDLLAHGDGNARHGQVAARPHALPVDLGRMDEEVHGRVRTGMSVQY